MNDRTNGMLMGVILTVTGATILIVSTLKTKSGTSNRTVSVQPSRPPAPLAPTHFIYDLPQALAYTCPSTPNSQMSKPVWLKMLSQYANPKAFSDLQLAWGHSNGVPASEFAECISYIELFRAWQSSTQGLTLFTALPHIFRKLIPVGILIAIAAFGLVSMKIACGFLHRRFATRLSVSYARGMSGEFCAIVTNLSPLLSTHLQGISRYHGNYLQGIWTRGNGYIGDSIDLNPGDSATLNWKPALPGNAENIGVQFHDDGGDIQSTSYPSSIRS